MTDPLPDEAWGFEWGDADGNGGFVRLALHRAQRIAWFWAYLWQPRAGPVVVRDHEVTLPRGAALEIRADALWSELVCETPGEHWSIGLEAFGVRLDDAEDARHGEIGERIALGFDFEWERTGAVCASELGGVTFDEQPGVVRGEILLGRDRIPLDTVGRFEHSIGAVDGPDPVSRHTFAWDDGSWQSGRSSTAGSVGCRWPAAGAADGDPLDGADGSGTVLHGVLATALIPMGDRVATRSLGPATSEGRTGVCWMESVA